MPWAGFEPQTLGAASSEGDHYTMPLPKKVLSESNKCPCGEITTNSTSATAHKNTKTQKTQKTQKHKNRNKN